MDGNELRRTFLRFFEERGHQVVPSSSLIAPVPGLLLTNAGMNQFVPYFLGQATPPYARAVSVQKCMRTGDIDNVGHDARHLTFFEMLGNFSFGDYFKKDAIRWAHQLVTEGYGIDGDRLWVTVFETDDEALQLWIDEVGLAPERIVKRGKFDQDGEPANFWWTHVAGPCGPCSEIYVDRGPKYGPEGGPDVDEERFLEIWNLVFMQDECDEHSNVIRELPRKNIDTGSSLERVAVAVQGADTVFDTDLFRPLIETAERLTGRLYGQEEPVDVSMRILAEHGRACAFLIGDGILPSNEGRGYVVRRMLRRLVTHVRKLGVDRPVMADLIDATVQVMGYAYPELAANRAFIQQVAASEEEHFAAAYRRGYPLFEDQVREAKALGTGSLPGESAFRLHDTHGFPLELTLELASEQGLAVDTEGFARLMEEQRKRARDASKKVEVGQAVERDEAGNVVASTALGDLAVSAGPTEFLGYERLEAEGRVIGLLLDGSRAEAATEGQRVRLVLDRTPFFAEGGGQVGDAGMATTSTGAIEVTDTRSGPGGTIVHEGTVASGEIRQGQEVQAAVHAERRVATARSHTATHVLHHTLRSFLGEHARQAGSLVAPGRLRFDFTHFEPVPRHVLEEIEYLANRRLADDQPVRAYETTLEFARSEGAIALFGEKYGDIVRVVEVGDYSVELCGGTHVVHTGEVALIRLVSEASIGSGFRRLEAFTGPDALKQVNLERRLLEEVMEAIGAGDPAQAPERVRHAVERVKQLEAELGKIRRVERQREIEEWIRPDSGYLQTVAGVSLLVIPTDGRTADDLREAALAIRNRFQRGGGLGAVVLGTASNGRALLVAASTDGLIARGVTAPALLEPAARAIGGGAGGKPNLAFAGGPRTAALGQALQEIPARLSALLAGA